MTKKELIESLKDVSDDTEIIVSIEDQVQDELGSMPILVPIDYVGGWFINVTIV